MEFQQVVVYTIVSIAPPTRRTSSRSIVSGKWRRDQYQKLDKQTPIRSDSGNPPGGESRFGRDKPVLFSDEALTASSARSGGLNGLDNDFSRRCYSCLGAIGGRRNGLQNILVSESCRFRAIRKTDDRLAMNLLCGRCQRGGGKVKFFRLGNCVSKVLQEVCLERVNRIWQR